MYMTAIEELELGDLRRRLRGMSESELLRFGLVARHSSHLRLNLDDRSCESFAMELREASEEWNRRKPKLPLRDSF
jgi:hypothetical protein